MPINPTPVPFPSPYNSTNQATSSWWVSVLLDLNARLSQRPRACARALTRRSVADTGMQAGSQLFPICVSFISIVACRLRGAV